MCAPPSGSGAGRDAVILAIDTATPAVTAGVVRRDGDGVEVLAERVTVDARAHAERLTPNVVGALADAGLTVDDLDAVVVGCGPGPFTGLAGRHGDGGRLRARAGHPGARGVQPGRDRRRTPTGDVLVVTDARRREVYWARYRDGVRVDGPAVNAPADVPAGAERGGRFARRTPPCSICRAIDRCTRPRRAWCGPWRIGRPSPSRWCRCTCAAPMPNRCRAGGDAR